jgi:hypothetical protein
MRCFVLLIGPCLCLPQQLADFGLSRVLETHATHVSTKTYGTLAYMPGPPPGSPSPSPLRGALHPYIGVHHWMHALSAPCGALWQCGGVRPCVLHSSIKMVSLLRASRQ